MGEVVFRKRGRSFVPIDREGLDLLAPIPDEEDVTIEVKRRRNPRHHRLFFAMLKFVVDHGNIFQTTDAALIGIKVACGLVDPFIDPHSGKTFFVVRRSISFAAMDQTAFAAFFDRAVFVIAERWMPEGTTPESVRAEILAMIEPVNKRDHQGERAA
jgi:hypothetical protein